LASVVLAGFLLFCLVLTWQPWNARLHLPLFLLLAPVFAAAAAMLFSGRAARGIGATLLLLALPWAIGNATRSLIGEASVFAVSRLSQYFAVRPNLERSYRSAMDLIRRSGCDRIGFLFRPDEVESPFWSFLSLDSEPRRFEHVFVKNKSARLAAKAPFATFSPCVIVVGEAASMSPNPADPLSWPGGRLRVLAVPVTLR
jgi:hypothetical protein